MLIQAHEDSRFDRSKTVGTVASKATNGILSGTLLDEAWTHLNAEVASHFLDRYREQLRG